MCSAVQWTHLSMAYWCHSKEKLANMRFILKIRYSLQQAYYLMQLYVCTIYTIEAWDLHQYSYCRLLSCWLLYISNTKSHKVIKYFSIGNVEKISLKKSVYSYILWKKVRKYRKPITTRVPNFMTFRVRSCSDKNTTDCGDKTRRLP
jgi:hypothetical protein